MEVERMMSDVSVAEKTLLEVAAKLAGSCTGQTTEWKDQLRVRSEEVLAIHDTMKLFSRDDSPDSLKTM